MATNRLPKKESAQVRKSIKPSQSDDSINETRAPAVNRAIQIIRLLVDSPKAIGVNAIAREVGIVPSTCLHILRALEIEEIVSVSKEDRRYTVGFGLAALARRALKRIRPSEEAQNEIDQIAGHYDVTLVLVQVISGDRAVIAAGGKSERAFQLEIEIGRRFPAFLSATGRCVAAYSQLSRIELRNKFNEIQWDNAPDFEQWLREIDDVRRNGWGVDDGNFRRGHMVISAPVFSEGRMVQSVMAIFARDQVAPNTLQELKIAIKEAATRLSN